jgi:hypothetical protein
LSTATIASQTNGPEIVSSIYKNRVKGGRMEGGTGQALRIAKRNFIPIFNLYNKDCLHQIKLHITK